MEPAAGTREPRRLKIVADAAAPLARSAAFCIFPNLEETAQEKHGGRIMLRERSWIGRSEERRDVIAPWPAAALHAALDLPGEPPQKGDLLPPLWRWMYFLETRRRSELGREGAPERGGDLNPPLKLPRRLWTGGRLVFKRQIKVGANATRFSQIKDLRRQKGPLGDRAFLTVAHEVRTADGVMETEEQDVVFRPEREPDPTADRAHWLEAREDESWIRVWTADPMLLFRYAALTYNAHRIHYDLDFCRESEGYSGLLVQSTLLATLMLELAREQGPDKRIAEFEFRTVSPVLHTEAFEVCGRPFEIEEEAATRNGGAKLRSGADLWVRAAGPSGRWGGRLAMSGRLTYVE